MWTTQESDMSANLQGIGKDTYVSSGISLRNHISNAYPGIWLFLAVAVGFYYGIYRYGWENSSAYLEIATLILIIGGLPQFIIHLNYFMVNRMDNVIIDMFDRNITLYHRSEQYILSLEMLKKVTAYMSPNLANDRYLFTHIDQYHHAVLEFEDGRSIVLTSLLTPRIDFRKFPAGKITVKQSVFRWAPKHRL